MSTGRLRKTLAAVACLLVALSTAVVAAAPAPAPFTLEQALSFPFIPELVAAEQAPRIAWISLERGVRNVWVAEAPEWKARALTRFDRDDGQELTQLEISRDGGWVVFVRGGDHDSNWPVKVEPNPTSDPRRAKVEIWAAPWTGGEARALADGDQPALSPVGDRVAFVKDGEVTAVALDAKAGKAEAKPLFFVRGEVSDLRLSPDGTRLVFTCGRGGHSLIGLYSGDGQPLRYLAPSFARDSMPRFSPDGKRVAFVRQDGQGGPPQTLLEEHPDPFELWVADVASGAGRRVWASPRTLAGSAPWTQGWVNLDWAAGDRLVFLAELDGWPHLYSVALAGGEPRLLTPGKFMVEYAALTRDRSAFVYNANTGAGPDDDDRRHLFRVPVAGGAPVALTAGAGIEWLPAPLPDGGVAFVSADARRPGLPAILAPGARAPRLLATETVPADFAGSRFVEPRKVVFRAADGTEIHGQLFAPDAGAAKPAAGPRAAAIFVHGGPPRQMLLGFHYMDYYAYAYAMNQYLASRGFVALAINYRLGIGYGRAFQHAPHTGPTGAAEYQDVVAAAKFLAAQPGVDPRRIGIWGGSYGGYLTALALARDSELFAAGVDIHGVHDWMGEISDYKDAAQRYEKPADLAQATDVAWQSSPDSAVATWKSPVLLIHGDDDHNVHVQQTVDLIQRLRERGVRYEEMILPDEIHDFLRHATWLKVYAATEEFLARELAVAKAH